MVCSRCGLELTGEDPGTDIDDKIMTGVPAPAKPAWNKTSTRW